MEAALERAAAEISASLSTVLARIDQRATDVQGTVEQTGTILSSYLGEIEDRLEQRMVAMKLPPEACQILEEPEHDGFTYPEERTNEPHASLTWIGAMK